MNCNKIVLSYIKYTFPLWCIADITEQNNKVTRYDYNLTIMKSPKPAIDTIYPHIKF